MLKARASRIADTINEESTPAREEGTERHVGDLLPRDGEIQRARDALDPFVLARAVVLRPIGQRAVAQLVHVPAREVEAKRRAGLDASYRAEQGRPHPERTPTS